MQTYVQWGRGTSCSNGQATLYTGYAASTGSGNSGRTEMVCVDEGHAGHATSSSSNDNGGLFYPHQASGGAADDAYVAAGGTIGCSVCGVSANSGAVYVQYGATTCSGTGSSTL